MRFVWLLLGAVLAAAVNYLAWSLPNRPQQVAAPAAGALASVSFAPFREGQSPLTQTYPTAQQIEADLAVLQGRALGVRTYTSREGLEIVPALAAKYGLTVTHSAWLGAQAEINEAEIAALIAAANAHPDTIKRVIVGNEVLLRRDLPPAELAAQLRRVRQAVRQPVSYADVWEFWLQNRQLAAEVDFITVHFLPYWEDDPVGVEQAMTHIRDVHRIVREAFPGKPILIGEVGWPTAGRAREDAVPGRVEAAEFLAAFTRLAAEQGFDYNVVEAFDQVWKTRLEGRVGGAWGILDEERRPKFPPGAPVSPNPDWLMLFALSLAGAGVLLAWAPGGFANALLAQAFAAALVWNAWDGWRFSHYWYEWLPAIAMFLVQTALALLLLREAAGGARSPWRDRLLIAAALWALYNAAMFVVAWRYKAGGIDFALDDWLNWLRQFAWPVPRSGRYRDFPLDDFLVPAVGLLAIWALQGRAALTDTLRSWRWLGVALPLAAVLLVLVESAENRQALAFAAILFALAAPYAAVHRRLFR